MGSCHGMDALQGCETYHLTMFIAQAVLPTLLESLDQLAGGMVQAKSRDGSGNLSGVQTVRSLQSLLKKVSHSELQQASVPENKPNEVVRSQSAEDKTKTDDFRAKAEDQKVEAEYQKVKKADDQKVKADDQKVKELGKDKCIKNGKGLLKKGFFNI